MRFLRRWATGLGFAAALAGAGNARAQSSDDPTWIDEDWEESEREAQGVAKRPRAVAQAPAPALALMVHAGIATPYGGIGAALGASLASAFAIEAGVGTNGLGPEYAGMGRFRLGIEPKAMVVFGAGIGTAEYESQRENGIFRPLSAMGHTANASKHWDRAWFLNLELGLETHAAGSPFVARPYVGYAFILNSADHECIRYPDDEPCESTPDGGVAYIGIALGFELIRPAQHQKAARTPE
jgi:hypothetical protein